MTNIKKIGIGFLSIILLASLTFAASIASWNIDKPHSTVKFVATHFFAEVHGQFTEFSGDLNFDPNDLEHSSVTFTIPVSSVSTGDAKRDAHLQSNDFFDGKKWPNITFRSTRFETESDEAFWVYGDLTIRDITRKVRLPIKVVGRMDHPFKKDMEILGVSLTTKISRGNFGVGSGSWAASTVVGEEVLVKIDMELNRKK